MIPYQENLINHSQIMQVCLPSHLLLCGAYVLRNVKDQQIRESFSLRKLHFIKRINPNYSIKIIRFYKISSIKLEYEIYFSLVSA